MWVKHDEIGQSRSLWLQDRLPYRVAVTEAVRRHYEPHLPARYEWCNENIGEACLRYLLSDPIRYDVPWTNTEGMWTYLHGSFRFHREIDACAFKLRWC
ncbi:MAG: hypothetical protein EOP83_19990 [Verrucomicrobiaceae bacterium]|nr:MAG: hypothetical protein EOP83_19990 [Verrucomicrobiaceae bacterium]